MNMILTVAPVRHVVNLFPTLGCENAVLSGGGTRLGRIWARMSNDFRHVVYTKVLKS